jgi:putative tryptophan/tyrosine transport system substrate-binding protein
MRRREFVISLGSAACPFVARGQQGATRTVGVLGLGSLENARAFFAPALRRLGEMGYVDGRNLVVEYLTDSREDRLGAVASDLVQHRVDAIAAYSGQSIIAAKAATTSIPIIFFTGYDPVASGFVASLSRPGGNVTGVSVLNTEMLAKRLQLLCEFLPTAKSIAALVSPTNVVSGQDLLTKELQSTADALGVKLLGVEVRHSGDFEEAFAKIGRAKSDALWVGADALMSSNRQTIVDLAARYKIPALYANREFVSGGGLVSYGSNYPEAREQVGVYLGRVLNGEKPENLPVQQVTKLELVINMKTAKTLGLPVPVSLLARADEVIE